MAVEKSARKNVWQHIFRLVSPYKKRLTGIFVISLLGTVVTLVEPLIYREAVNDIAGLYVQKARNEVKNEMGVDTETEDDPLSKLIDQKLHKKTGADSARAERKTHKPHRKKEPHSTTHVAPRTKNEAFNTLLWSVVLLFVINILGLIFWRIGENMNIRLSCTIEKSFIKQTFSHVLKLPLSFFSKRSSAALHKQIDQSEEISGTVSFFTKDIFPEVISLTGTLVIMFWQNYVLALLALSVIPIYILITIRSTRRLEMSLAGYYEKWEDVSASMQDALAGIKTVKLSGAEQREVNKLDTQASEAYKDYIQRSLLSNKYSFWQTLLTHLATAMVLAYGGYLALNHKLTPGDVVMFVAYLDMLYQPIDNLSSIWAEVQQNVTSVARAFKILDTTVTEKEGKTLQLQQGLVEFRDVHFGYTPEREVLKGLSFTAMPGKVTAIVGTSGAGKTTTVDLLLKLYEPQAGDIFIDGQRLSEADAASIRQRVGMVAADGAIFRGTLADNIRYKKPDATDSEVMMAANAAGMQSTLQRLTDGLQTIVGESGFGLSVGERQRLQIARVIISQPVILVMDEATANLDYATEAEVKKSIDTISKEHTVIIIAHRYSMVKDADHVIVLDAGEVMEEGTPAALIEKGGWFTSFANAGDEEDETEEEIEDIEEEEEDDDETEEEE
ncbi:MAG: ABC transporter ATP-binding protein [Chitinophagaceae bacterium]